MSVKCRACITCSFPDCDRRAEGHGLCQSHNQQRRRRGYLSPLYPKSRPQVERFWEKVAKGDGCWEWTASRFVTGYGQFNAGGTMVLAHRWSYEHTIGPIPTGLHLDHLCRNRICVRPEHLEPVTCRENVRRGIGGAVTRARMLAITHCPHGHPYSAENTYFIRYAGSVHRRCKTCERKWQRERYKRRRAREMQT